MSRNPHEPDEKTRKQVQMLVAMGIPEIDVGKFVGISLPTLRKYYAHEIEVGHIQPNANVANSLYSLATNKEKPNVTACIFWLKCRAGWREEDAPPLGKKEMADLVARISSKGSQWEDLLDK